MRHDGGPLVVAPWTVVATWPVGSFAENIAVDAAGGLFVSLHTDRAVVRVDPATGSVSPFATFETPVAGLAFLPGGDLAVGGGTPGQHPGVIWRVTPGGTVSRLADLPDARFLNGMTPLAGRLLVADSLGGRIWMVDSRDGTVAPWLSDPRLGPADTSGTPGANGIKLFGGHAFVSVTGTDTIYRVPMADGIAGPLATYAERLRADDFAIDATGALYIATHPARSLVRLDLDGTRTTLAGAAQGMTGATAVAFGRTDADRRSVYVTTTGGTGTLPPGEVQPAKLVRVEVDALAAPVEDAPMNDPSTDTAP